tara:strand:+ start:360 stop:632 length:273 start_codon:yes stop_codon:yes gene_type:complete
MVSISIYNITFPIDKFNTSFQLIVDNFSSFTELGHLPDWYESSLIGKRAARPARELQDEMDDKNGRSLRSLEFASQLPGAGPGLHRTVMV